MTKQLSFEIAADELDMFLQDVNDCLDTMEASILRLEQKHDPEILNAAFRAAHSLKALGGAIGHRAMAELTHTVESLFDDMREGKLEPTQTVADELLKVVDALKLLRNEVIDNQPGNVNVKRLIKRLQSLKENDSRQEAAADAQEQPLQLTVEQSGKIAMAIEAGQTLLHIDIKTKEETFASAARLYQAGLVAMKLGDLLLQWPALPELGENDTRLQLVLATETAVPDLQIQLGAVQDIDSVQIRPYSSLSRIEPSPKSTPVASNVNGAQPAHDKMVRISVERLDSLMNLVGELVTGRTRLLQIENILNTRYQQDNEIDALSEMIPQFSHVIDQLQEEVMRARMVPIANLFNKFPRLVRDVARRTDKQVDLHIEGEGTELDRAVVELIHDPIVHILRNAVGHGLETAVEREAAGKPATGTIQLSAEAVEGQIVLTITDDGRGIDPDRIRKKAISRQIVSEEDAQQLSDAEIVDLIFLPNMTTADKVTEISGRGVGLDVVRSNIETLGGSVFATSQPGEGTTFQLTLPLTLALVQTMLVTIHGTMYALPVLGINAAMYMADADLTTVKGKLAIHWAEDVIPVLDLRELFAPAQVAVNNTSRQKPRIVIVSWGKIRMGLIVDQIIGQQEIVVKSLSPLLGRVAGLSGATILGDGRIALIVDIPGLVNLALYERRTRL